MKHLFIALILIPVSALAQERDARLQIDTAMCRQEEGLDALLKDQESGDQRAFNLDVVGYGCGNSSAIVGYEPIRVWKEKGWKAHIATYPNGYDYWVPASRLIEYPKRPE